MFSVGSPWKIAPGRPGYFFSLNFLTKDGRNWVPGPAKDRAFICNVHYSNCQGSTRDNTDVLPTIFVHRQFVKYLVIRYKPAHTGDDDIPAVQEDEESTSEEPVCGVRSAWWQIRHNTVWWWSINGSEWAVRTYFVFRRNKFLSDGQISPLEECQLKSKFSQETLQDDNLIKFYTEITSKSLLNCLFAWLEPHAMMVDPFKKDTSYVTSQSADLSTSQSSDLSISHKRRLSLNDELLTLVRIRQGFPEQDLAYRFGISQAYLSLLLNAWIPFLKA